MIQLFSFPNHTINTAQFKHVLHDQVVLDFERAFADYVGAQYACSFSSATNAIFLALRHKNVTVRVPSILPHVVVNAIVLAGCKCEFVDNVNWVGSSYVLHKFDDYKIIDSAQRVDYSQFRNEADPNDLMVFSFYPTKPVGGIDGGMIVSDDRDKIEQLRQVSFNGTTFAVNNWERQIKSVGWKMYLNSVQAQVAYTNLRNLDANKRVIAKIRDEYNMRLGYENHSDHLYRIKVRNNTEFLEYMRGGGVVCGIHYRALHLMPPFHDFQTSGGLPASEEANYSTATIPMHPQLSQSDIERVCYLVESYRDRVS